VHRRSPVCGGPLLTLALLVATIFLMAVKP
jgi:hypothetical protein